ncbi:MAG: tetratricopeptide repeat protein [Campylobacterota bacterium]|nr:tetratricopeptide repeat protein [Campylobacterota bacterium]
MRILAIILYLSLSLSAVDTDTCYSVQLLSFPASQSKADVFVPENCQIITIAKSSSVRCGCVNDFKESKKMLLHYKKNYPKAMVSSTYRYRFSNKDKKAVDTKVTQSVIKKTEPKVSDKKTCYSIQLKSARKIKKSALIQTLLDNDSCRIFSLSGYKALRCGCYDNYKLSQNEQKNYLEDFPRSMIVTSYAYRFDTKPEKDAQEDRIEKPRLNYSLNSKVQSKDDEQLRLMYQVFTYSSDLKNAYKVAKQAIRKYPNSLYWHSKMAEISQWLDKRSEAINHRLYIYNTTRDKALGDDILEYALSTYQYTIAAPLLKEKIEENPSHENIKNLIFIYDKVGEPEVASEVLETLYDQKKVDLFALQEALRININLGDIEASERVVDKILKEENISADLAQLLSYYYFTKQNIKESYKVLLHADLLTHEGNQTAYYREISDIGWYLEDFNTSAYASKTLFKRNEARLVDYERILQYFDQETDLLADVAYRGYKKFHKKYIFMSYLNILINNQKYDRLASVFKEYELNGEDKQFENEALYWIIKAQNHVHFKEHDKAIYAFEKALKLEPDSHSVLLAYLWFLIDEEDQYNLKKLIFDLEEKGNASSDLWLALGVGNFQLQRSDRAFNYISKLMDIQSNNIDVKFLYAYIMQTREETDAFMQTMQSIRDIMQEQKEKNPLLMQDDDFLERYLKSSMYFLPSDEFVSLLERSKNVLKPRSYTEISIFWALRHDEKERARFLAGLLSYVEPWMQLSMAMSFDSRTRQMDLLYRYYEVLPIRDRVSAAVSTGQISLAQTLAFEGQENNKYDYLLYTQGRDLAEANVNKLTVKSAYVNRNILEQYVLQGDNRYYLSKGYSFLSEIYLADNHTLDDTQLATVPYYDRSLHVGIHKKLTRGFIEAKAGIRSAMDDYYSYSLLLNYQLNSRLNLELSYKSGVNAEETSYLLLGGKKDRIAGRLQYQILPSSRLSLYMSSNEYYSQDDYYLGQGYSGRLEWSKILHSGYPDLLWGLYYDFGTYQEDKGYRGVIEILQPVRTYALAQDFYNIGMNLFYGLVNKETYTRVWRPYFEFIPYYNGFAEQYNFAMSAGVGGLGFDQDHINFGVTYNQAVNGTQESFLELFMRYKLLY